MTECIKNKKLLPVDTFHPRLLVRPGEAILTPQARKVKKKRPPEQAPVPNVSSSLAVTPVKPQQQPQVRPPQPMGQQPRPQLGQPQPQRPPLQQSGPQISQARPQLVRPPAPSQSPQ